MNLCAQLNLPEELKPYAPLVLEIQNLRDAQRVAQEAYQLISLTKKDNSSRGNSQQSKRTFPRSQSRIQDFDTQSVVTSKAKPTEMAKL